MITQAHPILPQPPSALPAGSRGGNEQQDGDLFMQLLTYVQKLLTFEGMNGEATPVTSSSTIFPQSLLTEAEHPEDTTRTLLNPVQDEQERQALENVLQSLQEILQQLPIDAHHTLSAVPDIGTQAVDDLLTTGEDQQDGEAIPLPLMATLFPQIIAIEQAAMPSAPSAAVPYRETPTSLPLPFPPAQEVHASSGVLAASQQTAVRQPFIGHAITGDPPVVVPAAQPATTAASSGEMTASQSTTTTEPFTPAALTNEISGVPLTSQPTTNAAHATIPSMLPPDMPVPEVATFQSPSAPLAVGGDGDPVLPLPDASTPESFHRPAITVRQDREGLTVLQQEGERATPMLTAFQGDGRHAVTAGEASLTSTEEQPATVPQRAYPLDTETATKLLGRPLPRNTVLLQLEPPELGQLLVHVRVTGESVAASFWAKSSEVRALLHTHFPALNQALSQQGFDTQHISISLAAEGSVNQSGQSGHHQSAFHSFAHGREHDFPENHSDSFETERSVTFRQRSNGLIDVLI